MEQKEIKPKLSDRFKSGLLRYGRVWKLLKKPSYEEFKMTAKISAIGLLVVGAIGFIISVAINVVTLSWFNKKIYKH